MLFALVVSHLRTREQIERLVAVVLLTSFPVALNAIVQWWGWDPIRPEARGGRVFSTLGNPIYLAGYLVMIIPLTIWKIFRLQKSAGYNNKCQKQMLQALFWLILCTQVTALLLTGSRGPTLAAGAGLFTFALLYATLKSWKVVSRSLAAFAVCTVLAGAAVVWIKHREAPANAPSFSFLGDRGDSGRGELWNKASVMLLSHNDKVPPALAGDPWQNLRTWIGHGPETLPAVLPFYFSFWGSWVLESWFHNIVWDLWWSYGLLGAGVFLTFLGLLFFLAYQRLGWIVSRSNGITFWVTSIVLTLIGAFVLPLLLNNTGFAGMGAVLGLASALILYPAWHGNANVIKPPVSEQSYEVLVAALAAGLAGHLVDLAFVFPTASTSVLFWICAGVIIVLCRDREDFTAASEAAPPRVKGHGPYLNHPAQGVCSLPFPVAVALVTSGMIALLHVSIDSCSGFPRRFSITELLSIALFNSHSAQGPFSLMILPVALYWSGASLTLAATTSNKGCQSAFLQRLIWTLGVSGAGGLLFALLESFLITRSVPLPEMRILSAAAFDRVHDQEVLFLGQLGIILSLVILAGLNLVTRARNQAPDSRPGWAACCLALIATVVLIYSTVLVPARADLFIQEGLSMQAAGRASLSSDLFKHALALNPRPFVYRSMLSESLINDAVAMSDGFRAAHLLAEAESVLKDGSQPRPVNRTAYYLGRVYLHWALREAGESRAKLADKASTAFDQARDSEPYTEQIWSESGIVELLLHKDAAAAKHMLERARQLAAPSLLAFAEFYAGRSLHSRDAEMTQKFAEIADSYFDGAIQDTKLAKVLTSQARIDKGLLQLMMKHPDAALANLNEAVKLGVESDQWEIEMLLAEGFMQKADRAAARKHLERSLAKAPPEKRHMLRPLQLELGVL